MLKKIVPKADRQMYLRIARTSFAVDEVTLDVRADIIELPPDRAGFARRAPSGRPPSWTLTIHSPEDGLARHLAKHAGKMVAIAARYHNKPIAPGNPEYRSRGRLRAHAIVGNAVEWRVESTRESPPLQRIVR